MRVCHLDTCPVGVATQNPELRARFSGQPEFVVNFFEYIAEEVRELLASLGFRTLEEAIGRADVLDVTERRRPLEGGRARPQRRSCTCRESTPDAGPATAVRAQDHGLDRALDQTLIELAGPALERRRPRRQLDLPIRNVNRTVGTMLGSRAHPPLRRRGPARRHDHDPPHRLGRQSLGAFLPRGITLRLEGDANDYVGKGLSGGRVVIRPAGPQRHLRRPRRTSSPATSILYGATGGEVFLRGVVGERFCVRNSGATAVVEGVGDHGCEYMTGGRVVVLGPHRAQLRRRHVGRRRLRVRPRRHVPRRSSTSRWSTSTRSTDEDRAFLRDRVKRHHEETDSAVAARLLDRLDAALPNGSSR